MYILECRDGTLYTGYTSDLRRRLREHNQGLGSRYTRGRTPVKVVYREEYSTQRAAMRREAELKELSRSGKKRLFGG